MTEVAKDIVVVALTALAVIFFVMEAYGQPRGSQVRFGWLGLALLAVAWLVWVIA